MPFVYGTIWATGVPGNSANMAKNLCGHGLFSELPAPAPYVSVASPGNAGMIAHATDRNLLYRSDGSAWIPVGIALPSGSASGDIYYFDGTAVQRRAKGTDGQYLSLASGLPVWQSPPAQFATQVDVTASRTFGTNYQNTTGKPMLIQVGTGVTPAYSENGGIIARAGSSTPPTLIVARTRIFQQASVLGAWTCSVTFMVLAGHYYKVDFDTTTSGVAYWIETY